MAVRGEGEGASAGGLAWGWASRSRELRPGSEHPLFLAPLLALVSFRLARRERGRSQRELDAASGQRRRSDLHCPVSSSSDSTASGKALTRSTYPGGRVASKSRAPRATHAQPGAHYDTGTRMDKGIAGRSEFRRRLSRTGRPRAP